VRLFRSELGEWQGRMTGEIKIGMDDNLTSISAWSLTQILDSHIGGVSNA
jgi:hypothetical protein